MTIADVPGEPRQLCGLGGRDLDQRLGLAGDAHDRAVVEHQPVAVAQRGGVRQIEQKGEPALGREHHAAAMALARIEHHPVDRRGIVPLSGRPHRACPAHARRRQNRKYRCAMGSTSAGAQVSSSPSARTS